MSDRPGRLEDPRLSAAALSLLLVALLSPLVMLPGVLYPYIVPRTVFFRTVVSAAALLLVWRLLTGSARWRARRDPVLVGMVGLLAVSMVASLLGVAPTRSLFGDLERLWGVWTWLHLVLFYVLLRTFVAPSRWPLVLDVAIGVMAIVAFSVFAEGVALRPFYSASESRPDGLVGNPGYVGGVLLLGFGLVGHRLLAEPGRRRRLPALVALPLLAAAFLMVQTRAAILGAVVGLAVAAVPLVPVLRRRLKGGLAVVVAAVAVVLLISAAIATVRAAPRGIERLQLADVAVQQRLALWDAALRAYPERPVLGYGPENVTIAVSHHVLPDHYVRHLGGLRANRSHNAWLDTLVATGPVGLLFHLAIWGGLLWLTLRAHRRDPDGRWIPVLAATAAYAVYLTFWFEELNAWILAAVIAAHVSTRVNGPLVAFEEPREGKRSLLVLAAVVVVVMTYLQGWWPLRQTAILGEAEHGVALSWETRFDRYEEAHRSPATQKTEGIYLHERALQRLLQEPVLDRYRLSRILESAGAGLAAAKSAIARDPLNDLLHGRVAGFSMILYQGTRQDTFLVEAVAATRRAEALAPGKIRYRHLRSQTWLAADSVGRARAVLEPLVAGDTLFGETRYYMGRTALAAGDTAEAVDWVRDALDLGYAPDPTDMVRDLGLYADRVGRHDDAAELYADYLRRNSSFMSRARNPDAADVPALDAIDRHVAGRLPPLLAAVGARDSAIVWALRTGTALPSDRARVERFLSTLRRAGTRAAADLRTVTAIDSLAAPQPR